MSATATVRDEQYLTRQDTKTGAATILCTSPFQGGTERVVQILAAALARQGFVAEVFIPASGASEAIESTTRWYAEKGVAVKTNAAFSRQNRGLKNIGALARLLRERPGSTVNIHYTETVSVALSDVLAARLAGKRCVVSIHHPTPWDMTSVKKQRAIALALRLAHAVVVTTEYTKELVRQMLPEPDKISVIGCGVPPPVDAPSRTEARMQLGLPPDVFVISTLCRLVDYKGVDDVIQALAALPKLDNILYLVAGDGPDRAKYEAMADQLLGGHALFLGRVSDEDIQRVLAASDVFAMPSHMEGFGLVYIEAAFHGVPSIGCDVAGVPYAIAAGETGLLVPVGDIQALTGAIQALSNDSGLRLKLGEAARTRALSEFTDDVMAKKYGAVLFA